MSSLRTLTTAAATLLLAAPAAHAAFPGANGPIVAEHAGGLQRVTPGSTARPFADPARYDPAVSPDGTRVAYTFQRDIWTVDANGHHARRVTRDAADNSGPAWSPNGRRIVYATRTATSVDLAVVRATGGAPKLLTATPDHDERNPAWSPDGRQIAYERSGCDTPHGGGTCVFVMGARGRAATNLTPENSVPGCERFPGYFFNGGSKEPSWSPDSQLIAFSGPLDCQVSAIGSDVWTMSRTGAGKRDLTSDDGTNDAGPAFSPNGRSIVFHRSGVNVVGGLVAIASTGGPATRITTGENDLHPDWGVRAKPHGRN